jgi:hypothetical protein
LQDAPDEEVFDHIRRFNGEDEFEDIHTINFIPVTARIARRNLHWMEVTYFQWAALRHGLIRHPDDRVSNTLEEVMRYLAMVGWMCFDQMATMNARIPLYGDGNYTQLRGDMVNHDERIEALERNWDGHNCEINELFQRDWDKVRELRERMDTLEQTLEVTQAALGRATVEMVRLRAVTNTNNMRLAAVLHGRENPVLVESSPELEAGPSQFPQMGEEDPHRLVPIEDLGSALESGEDDVFDEDREVVESMTSWASSPVL